jgi:ankyrin repeat protein
MRKEICAFLLIGILLTAAVHANPPVSPQDKEVIKFHLAVRYGKLDIVKDFLASKPELIHNTQFCGRAPLHEAVIYHHKDVVELLIEKGADVNIRDAKGYTPLSYARMIRHQQIITLLQAHHAHE